MRRPRYTLRNERGIALILAILVLLCLTGLVVAYLSVSAIEPQISRNLADASRSRYLAEAGIERGFNVLVASTDWTSLVTTASAGSPWVAVAGLTNTAISGATAGGTFSVTVRNDNGGSDTPLTGLTGSTNPTMDNSPSVDSNGVLIMRSSGTFNGMTKTIEVVIRRTSLPPFPGAVNIPGRQSDTLVNSAAIDFDGRDYACASIGSACDTASNWNTTANPMKYGMAAQPGTQTNLGVAFDTNVKNGLNTPAKQSAVKGKSQTTGAYTTGTDTVAADASLNPTVMDKFVDLVASNPSTTILQSTMGCPMVFTGAASGLTNTPTLTNGCGTNTTVNLGSRQDPKLVFFRGDIDTSSAFVGLSLNNGIKGAGILVIQDGDMRNYGTLEWDGLVIVTGNYTSMALWDRSSTTIRGAAVAYEANAGEASGYFDFYIGNVTSASIRSSKQNVDMVQLMRSLHSVTNWREI